MPVSPPASQFRFVVATKPSRFPLDARRALEADPIKANVILPILLKCEAEETNGRPPNDHVWVVVYGGGRVKLIASSTDGCIGKYPIFLFSPLSNAQLRHEPISLAIDIAAHELQRAVGTQRVYSVFGTEMLAKAFASIWSRMTGIHIERDPYYLAKISYATRDTLVLPTSPNDAVGIRPAVPGDIHGIADLCYRFAAESPPFLLNHEQALMEATYLVMNHLVWVHAVATGRQTRISSMVAFTRNSDRVATITKVYTHPDFRGQGIAEKLVRHVCIQLLSTGNLGAIALFVGVDNRAANVYHRVGFVGLVPNAAPVPGVETWIEIGFDQQRVQLGHW